MDDAIEDGVDLHINFPPTSLEGRNQLVTTELLGEARTPGLPFVNPDGTPLIIDSDYLARKRNEQNPSAGPFENPAEGQVRLKVWAFRQ